MSQGIVLVGIGGSGRAVVDGTLKLLPDWRKEGVVVRLIDVITRDETAEMPPGAAVIDPGTAEDRFFHSDADCRTIIDSARRNGPPTAYPWLTKEIAESITPPTPGTGAGGDRLASYIIAEEGKASMANALETAVSEARQQIAEAGRNPTVFVIAGGAGGVGSGHMVPVLNRILRVTRGEIDLVPIMLTGAYSGKHFTDEAKREQAWNRAMALQRELEAFSDQDIQLKFIIGGGPASYAHVKSNQGVLAGVSLWLSTMIRNQSTYNASRPNWVGTDLANAKRAERNSTIGASRIAYRADMIADWLAKTIASEAWQMVVDRQNSTVEEGRGQASALMQMSAIGTMANRVKETPATEAVALVQLDEDETETLMNALSPSDDFPQVIDFDDSVRKELPMFGGMPKSEFFALCDEYSIQLREELEQYIRRGRRDWKIQVTEGIRLDLEEAFSGGGQGFVVGTDPQQLVRISSKLRAVADAYTKAAERIASTREQIENELKPIPEAEEAVAEQAELLSDRVKKGEAKPYLEARHHLAYCERWKAVCGAAIDLCRDLSEIAVSGAQPIERWLEMLKQFADEAHHEANKVAEDYYNIDFRPSIRLVPAPRGAAFQRLTDELRRELAAANGQPQPAKSALEQLKWRADLPANAIEKWGLRLSTPRVAEHIPAQDGFAYNDGAELPERVSRIASSFLWEMIDRGTAGTTGLGEISTRFSLYDALDAEYRAEFDTTGTVTPEAVRKFCGAFLNELFDNAGPLGQYEDTRPCGEPARNPIEHTYYFVDPSPGRRSSADPDDATPLSQQIRAQMLGELATNEQSTVKDGDAREFTKLNVTNGIHTELFEGLDHHLEHFRSARTPLHPFLGLERAREAERALHAQRLIGDRFLDADDVRLLAYANELRDLAQLIALDLLPTQDNPEDPAGGISQYVLNVDHSGRTIAVPLGDVTSPLDCIRLALTGPEADHTREAIQPLFRLGWSDLRESAGGREGAAEVRTAAIEQFHQRLPESDLTAILSYLLRP